MWSAFFPNEIVECGDIDAFREHENNDVSVCAARVWDLLQAYFVKDSDDDQC